MTYDTQRQLDDPIAPESPVYLARRLSLRREHDVTARDHGLAVREARVRVAHACLADVAADVYIGEGFVCDLQCGLDKDFARI